MKNLLLILVFASIFFTTCKTLTSTTSIKAKDAFILGNNKHGGFSVRLKNISNTDIEVWKCPINGGQHSPVVIKPKETIKVSVDRDTALRIDNKSDAEVAVELLVKGDTGLSMGYKN